MQPAYDKLYSLVERRLTQDFNCIHVDVAEAYLEKNEYSIAEQIVYTDRMRDMGFWVGHYPVWSTLLECSNGWMEEAILEKVDELYDIGIGVIEGVENLNTMLFIPSAGYDFVEKHFMKMYPKVFGMFVEEAEAVRIEHEAMRGVTL